MERLPVTEAEYARLAQLLRTVDLFGSLTVGQLEAILPAVFLYEYRAGETLMREGAPGDAFYLIHAGAAEVRMRRLFWFPRRVARLGPGDYCGEMALLSSEPRSASVVCTAASRVFALAASDFRYVLERNPELAAQMERTAARRRFLSSRGG